ncbi:MAG: amidase, partial [Alphaproteobacteria bacterium]
SLSAETLHRFIRAREFSCREVVVATLEQIDRFNGHPNAFALVDVDGALAAGEAADQRLSSGVETGPLHGIPFTVKDLIDTEGIETAFGSYLMQGNVPTRDAECVRRLKAAGAILIGKTTTPEFAGSVLTESIRYGVTRNPWNPEFSPGGSGVAVASGFGPLSLATDGAGSARIPASCCGVLGLKPTLGRVPHQLAPDLYGNFTHMGAMTQTVGDLALMLNVLSGPHPGDPWSVGRNWQPVAVSKARDRTMKAPRALYFAQIGNPYLANEFSKLCMRAIDYLKVYGLNIDEHTGEFDWFIDASRTIMRGLMSARMARFDASQRKRMGPTMQHSIQEGERVTGEAMKMAPILRSQLYRRVEGLLVENDLLLSPTVSGPPPKADIDPDGNYQVDGETVGDLRSGWFTYPTPFNLTGHPAISIPIGLTEYGLPVGIHAVSRWGDEQALIDLASVLSEHYRWEEAWPPILNGGSSNQRL